MVISVLEVLGDDVVVNKFISESAARITDIVWIIYISWGQSHQIENVFSPVTASDPFHLNRSTESVLFVILIVILYFVI